MKCPSYVAPYCNSFAIGIIQARKLVNFFEPQHEALSRIPLHSGEPNHSLAVQQDLLSESHGGWGKALGVTGQVDCAAGSTGAFSGPDFRSSGVALGKADRVTRRAENALKVL